MLSRYSTIVLLAIAGLALQACDRPERVVCRALSARQQQVDRQPYSTDPLPVTDHCDEYTRKPAEKP